MGIDDDVTKWFANMDSVMNNLGSLKMAQEALAVGKNYTFRYNSPSNSKSYNARQIVDIFSGTYDTSSSADVEFRGLILQGNQLLGLYLGYAQALIAKGQGRSFIQPYTSYNYNESAGTIAFRTRKSYGQHTLVDLYTDGRDMGKVAYPLHTV